MYNDDMNIVDVLKNNLAEILEEIGVQSEKEIHLEHPNDISHGDFATNVAMTLAKDLGKRPREIAEVITQKLLDKKIPEIEYVEVAGPGFINIKLSSLFFENSLKDILVQGMEFGNLDIWKGKKIIIEFTDPNPFKLLHIGHLMSNTIGESLARIFQISGAEVKWANYQGDVGMHVAKAIWGIIDLGGVDDIKNKTLKEQVSYLGKAYAKGAAQYKEGKHVEEIKNINKQIYEKSDQFINNIYDWGRQVSLDYFEIQYKRLGTYHNKDKDKAFHYYFFESQVGSLGKEKVFEYLKQGVFEESDGAIIFPGEKYGLHNRVFVNSLGLPTYEAKELGLSKTKYDLYQYDNSFIITANEIDEYFKVLLKAMSFVFPDLAKKTTHISHGMMKLKSGKMSSRTGDVIVAEDLLDNLEELVITKSAGRNLGKELISEIAVSAIKFAILKQDTSKDIIFDPETSLSFEGDSGPYLQYTHARCQSILAKAKEAELEINERRPESWETLDIEKYLYRLPEIFESAFIHHAPQQVATYIIELARLFNSWYGNTKIIDIENPETGYKLALTQAVAIVIKKSLWVLGIDAPNEM